MWIQKGVRCYMDMCKNYEDTVDVPIEEYKQLKEDQEFLHALQAYGVDSWEGYEEAVESVRS